MWQKITISGNKFLIAKPDMLQAKYVDSVSALSQFFNVILLQFEVLTTTADLEQTLGHCAPVQLYNVSQNFDRSTGVTFPQLSITRTPL